tara:strand:+ start:4252 stop:4746 length:495 start_codon:yes stop_codon:yes gene_type:complete
MKIGDNYMNKLNTDTLYERFAHLYREREREAPLKNSKMKWGFQCEDGWYKILYDMSKRITKISKDTDHAAAITEIGRHEDGTLKIEIRNPSPPVDTIVMGAREQSRLTCEYCSYSPAHVRSNGRQTKGHIACGRCVKRLEGSTKPGSARRRKKPLRAPDTIIVN